MLLLLLGDVLLISSDKALASTNSSSESSSSPDVNSSSKNDSTDVAVPRLSLGVKLYSSELLLLSLLLFKSSVFIVNDAWF